MSLVRDVRVTESKLVEMQFAFRADGEVVGARGCFEFYLNDGTATVYHGAPWSPHKDWPELVVDEAITAKAAELRILVEEAYVQRIGGVPLAIEAPEAAPRGIFDTVKEFTKEDLSVEG